MSEEVCGELKSNCDSVARDFNDACDKIRLLKSELAAARPLIRAAQNLTHSEPSFDDARISWVEVQVDRDELKEFREALAAYDQAVGKKEMI